MCEDNTIVPTYKNRIHEHTISLKFLGIILRVLRLEVCVMDFINHREGGMVFYQVFLHSPLQCTVSELKELYEVA